VIIKKLTDYRTSMMLNNPDFVGITNVVGGNDDALPAGRSSRPCPRNPAGRNSHLSRPGAASGSAGPHGRHGLGKNYFPFDPKATATFGTCHIVEHGTTR
jgi:hypothetical protein